MKELKMSFIFKRRDVDIGVNNSMTAATKFKQGGQEAAITVREIGKRFNSADTANTEKLTTVL